MLGGANASNAKAINAVCLFVCNRGDSFMSQDGLRTRKLCQSPMPDTAVTAESFAAPVLDVFLTPLHGSC